MRKRVLSNTGVLSLFVQTKPTPPNTLIKLLWGVMLAPVEDSLYQYRSDSGCGAREGGDLIVLVVVKDHTMWVAKIIFLYLEGWLWWYWNVIKLIGYKYKSEWRLSDDRVTWAKKCDVKWEIAKELEWDQWHDRVVARRSISLETLQKFYETNCIVCTRWRWTAPTEHHL